MTYEQILFETKENVAWIRLNRPERLNALTHQLSGEARGAPDPGGNGLLPRIVGYAKALELSITGEKIDAAEAHRIGMVSRVVPADAFPTELESFAQAIAQLPTRAIGATKRIMSEALSLTLP